MPTYEYLCEKCKHRFEKLESITKAPLKRCPLCRGRVRRLISGGAGLLFKGSGFYCTDSRKGSSGSAKRKDSGGESSDKGSSAKEGSGPEKSSSAKEESGAKKPSSADKD